MKRVRATLLAHIVAGYYFAPPSHAALLLAFTLISLVSSCVPTTFAKHDLEVSAAASAFYDQHGRWPTSAEALATEKTIKGEPLDLSSYHDLALHEMTNGDLLIRWNEGAGLSKAECKSVVRRPRESRSPSR